MEATTPTTPSLGAGDFIAINIGNSSTPAVERQDSTTNPRIQLNRTLSRKGFPTGGGGGRDTAGDGGGGGGAAGELAQASGGPNVLREGYGVHVHVEGGEDVFKASRVSTPTAATRGRRIGRRNSPWLDPRRVLLVFATMSSMGTLILLYFTLSMGIMTRGADANS